MQRKEFKRAKPRDASKLKVAIVVARFNADITEKMLEETLRTLSEWKVRKQNISIIRVPGSFEILYGCLRALRGKPHTIVALGCLVKGETKHDVYLASAVAHGIAKIILERSVPISFGIITPNTLAQARARTHHGAFAAAAALEAALMK